MFVLLNPTEVCRLKKGIYRDRELVVAAIGHQMIHSDEGLTLETSVFESFTVANLPYRPCG